MKIFPAAIDRLRDSKLSPENFLVGFEMLLEAVNATGEAGLALHLHYGDEEVGEDELMPIITLSFRGNHDAARPVQ